ncbi:helix-turn-helix transcriptional regulator [Escherichia coli]|uniref:helix-turn-helix transcriptional regulator n=1 Tax=Escherichia coli TaxID=562 RepID=UPI001C5EF427|nr:helix-turn-helix transcriptional regulator [Escherichia coli]EHH7599799.1 helix-turn-helix transcriptional regulator [Escherichia coli]ELX1904129.1 helix-turn-helix transcriptional regulator [Escherichia coli]HBB9936484.1 helix-turn-helix transcriptional regulator [Escherichia coli]HCO7660574.1 helix-turn-helix transcriptional regulator [Escherichia coli]
MNTSSKNNELDVVKSIRLENINTHRYSIIYTDNCEITFFADEEFFVVPQSSFLFIEKGLKYSCSLKKINAGLPPFKIICLVDEVLQILKCILTTVYDYKFDDKNLQRTMSDKIISFESCDELVSLYNNIINIIDKRRIALKIAYFISKMKFSEKVFHSVLISSAYTFTDKVKEIVCKDLSRKWRLTLIADVFNVSEVTVRKRLENEGTNFNNLLLSLRMNQAVKMLLENEKQIHQISELVGINSTSYFIKLFKEYYGITPKQYVIYFRS